MTEWMAWLDRTFDFTMPLTMIPNVLERLRGTPARLDDRLRDVLPHALVFHDRDTWSIKENIGHLVLTEALWLARLDDVQAGHDGLEAARFDRRLVDERHFDDQPTGDLLAAFRARRTRLVARIEGLDPALHERRAMHPRLKTRMRVLDQMVFTAEHDDHHLARITQLLRLAR